MNDPQPAETPEVCLPPHLRGAKPVERIILKATPRPSRLVLQSRPTTKAYGNDYRRPNNVRGRLHPNPSKRFSFDRDNDAKAAWRKGERELGFFELPRNYVRDDMDLSKREDTSSLAPLRNSLQSTLDQICLETEAYIRPPGSYSDRRLLIWGNLAQVKSAKTALRKWVVRFQGTLQVEGSKLGEFAKVTAELSEHKKAHLDRQMRDDAQRQSYRQAPGGKENFPATSTETVNKVLGRIRSTLYEIAFRNNTPTKLYLVDPPKSSEVRKEVEFKAKQTDKQGIPSVVPRIYGSRLSQKELSDWVELRPRLIAINDRCLKAALFRCLAGLRFYRGHVKMRVHFGTLILSSYRRPAGEKHSFEDFRTMMQHSQTQGKLLALSEVRREKGDLVSKCCRETAIFDPIDAMTTKLEDVQPAYSAMFDMVAISEEGPLRLEVEFARSSEVDEYEVSSYQWSRIEAPKVVRDESPTLAGPLAAAVVDLVGESAWQIVITTSNAVDSTRGTSKMRQFIECIRLKVRSSGGAKDDRPRLKYSQVLPVRSITQKTAYRYMLKGSTYLFEVARYQSPTNEAADPTGDLWGAMLYNSEWDHLLGQQASLSIGQHSTWSPQLKAFFPSNALSRGSSIGLGFHDFLAKVTSLAAFMKTEKAAVSSL
ncbi:MAG: hypothetical protein M1827_006528 [Pycnora praestabilis]|nr:MAG: hypothetical protein M1827_006528 [Pycnora praestabilis]